MEIYAGASCTPLPIYLLMSLFVAKFLILLLLRTVAIAETRLFKVFFPTCMKKSNYVTLGGLLRTHMIIPNTFIKGQPYRIVNSSSGRKHVCYFFRQAK